MQRDHLVTVSNLQFINYKFSWYNPYMRQLTGEDDMEKILKRAKRQMAQSGGLNIAIGATLLAVAIPLGVLSIISGSKLISIRKQL